jgi:hypothetical protein
LEQGSYASHAIITFMEINMEDTYYRVFYDYDSITWYTDTFITIEDARNAAKFHKNNCSNTNVRIVEEVTTRRVVELV